MKHSRVVMVVAVFLIIAGLLLVVLFSPLSLLGWKGLASTFSPVQDTNPMQTLIAKENAQLGTKKWQYNLDKGTSIYIQAYADTASAQPGQKVTFFVSTHDQGTRYTLSLYRLGWYGGDGARLMLSTSFLTGQAQGYYDGVQHALINCHSCRVNKDTGLVEANWHPSYTVSVPADWTTGVYLAKFTDEYDYTAAVPLDIRGNAHARYVVVTPDTNYQANNSWGGYSLYTANTSAVEHSVKVSFDRPYMFAQDTSQLFDSELDAIRWLEMQGYDLSYVSSVDVHEHPRLLLDHQAYLSLGEDTFWTKEMREGVEYARDHGVGLAFLGAETGTWQMRFEADHHGKPDRTVVSYRVTSASHNLQFDPVYGSDNTRVTTQWRDPLLAQPENALLGVMFSGFTTRPTNFSWQMSSHLKSPLLVATGLASNKKYGCGLVGNVWDRTFDNSATPPGLSVLATSQTTNNLDQPDVSNTTSYVASSGALVFAAGSLYWSRGLDGYRFHQDPQCPVQENAVPEIQRLMTNVMSALTTPHKPLQVSQVTPTASGARVPGALNAPGDQTQGGAVGTRNAPLPVLKPTYPAARPPQRSEPVPQQSGNASHAVPKTSTNKSQKTKRATPTSTNAPGSFRAGRRGRPVGSASPQQNHATLRQQSDASSNDQASSSAEKRQNQDSNSWDDIFSRIFHGCGCDSQARQE